MDGTALVVQEQHKITAMKSVEMPMTLVLSPVKMVALLLVMVAVLLAL